MLVALTSQKYHKLTIVSQSESTKRLNLRRHTWSMAQVSILIIPKVFRASDDQEMWSVHVRERSGSVDRNIDAIKNASEPSSKLQFCLKTQETTGPIFRNTCGLYDISQ